VAQVQTRHRKDTAYLPVVATTLNNLALLHRAKNELAEAEAEFAEALEIRRKLADINPSAYLPDVAMTLINVAIYHLQSTSDREHSIKCAMEAVMILLPIVEAVPYTQNYLRTAISV
jgi:tetratricopeptide (TPR) repeat protein